MGTESEKITQGVRVRVRSQYLPERSFPEQEVWVFAYEVKISNDGPRTVQLLRRHWHITDAAGESQEVEGPGVVGETPVLGEGEQFTYVSGCPLNTSFGTMHGTFLMKYVDDASHFDVEIGAFALCLPDQLN